MPPVGIEPTYQITLGYSIFFQISTVIEYACYIFLSEPLTASVATLTAMEAYITRPQVECLRSIHNK